MNRTLKLSFVSAFTMVGAAVIVACSSGAPADDSSDGLQRLSDYTVHPTAKTGCGAQNVNPAIVHQHFCHSVYRLDSTHVAPDLANPDAAAVSGFGPTDFASAYNIPSGLTGSPTVAIVDAQDDPNAESDLAVYRSQFGLPACTTANGCFKKVSQTGSTTGLPTGDTGWGGEISLDLDMVSAICPTCKILLVEAASAGDDLYTAEAYAGSQADVVAVSNSWSGSESSSETSTESTFNNGKFITVAAGDSDTGAGYPTTSAYVTAVGGTSLTKNSSARGWTEVVWDTSSSEGTGSGCSAYIAQPSFQTTTLTTCSKRAEADVSAVADPNTGVAVYDTYGGASAGASGWEVYGGTSAATPIVAAMFAYIGKATTATNAFSYNNTADFYDVTSGSNGTCSANKKICTAGVGWDGPTGNGTPNVGAIAGTSTPPPVDAGTDSGSKDSGTGTDSGVDAGKDSGVDAGKDAGTDAGGGSGTCSHDVCDTGKKLTKSCSTCAGDVCAEDSYCCNTKWDDICVSEVADFCAAGTESCN